MSTGTILTNFSAFGKGDLAVVRVVGPGTCRESGRFENLLIEVEGRGYRTLVVDLGDCGRLDSTFAGTLLRLAGRAESRRAGANPLRIVIARPQPQVAHVLDTLCLFGIFEIVELPDTSVLSDLCIKDRDLSRQEITEISLDGHERLAALSETNARQFAALLNLLRIELGKGGSVESAAAAPAGPCGKEAM